MGQIVVINDQNYQQHISPIVDGEQCHHGLVPRDFTALPQGCYAWAPAYPDDMLATDQEIDDLLSDQAKNGSELYELAHDTDIIDQDGYGYCWAHSSVMAVNLDRLLMGEPYVALSAFAVAAIIKGGRDEGGWGAESLDWIVKNGVPSQALWPQGDASLKHDTPALRADAATRKVTEFWDGSENVSTATRQMMTVLVRDKRPCVLDFNWWSHSVCGVRLVSRNPLQVDIKNSWKGWGDNGIGRLEGNRARPDGLVMPRVIMAGG